MPKQKTVKNQKEDILFIINPISGSRSKAALPVQIKRILDSSIYNPTIEFTNYPGHATEIAKSALGNGCKFIVAAGGDGTVNEIAKVLINTDVTLGILPEGSGNGLARHMKIPMRTELALSLINQRSSVVIDSCNMNGNPFFCTSGIGFDAHIGKLFAEQVKRGFSTYVKTTLNEFAKYKPLQYNIKTPDFSVDSKAFLITFANSAQYGNNAYISPEASISDGLIDICIMSPFPKLGILSMGYKLFSKSMNRSKFLKIVRANEVVVTRESEGPVHLDGEPFEMGSELIIKVNPSSLKIIGFN